MKRIILLAVLLTAIVWSYSQTDSVFYYYHGEHETYYQHNNAICFFLPPPTHTIPATLEAEMHRWNLHLSNQYSFLYPCYVAESNDNRPITDSVLHQFLSNPNIVSGGRLLEKENSFVYASNELIAKLDSATSIAQMEEYVRQNGCVLQGLLPYAKDEYLISNPAETHLSTMDMSNRFAESKLFVYAQPNFVYLNAEQSNDPYYSQQWGLHNVDQDGNSAGVDIHAEAAWTITKGNRNIKVAVIDKGIDITHPDLRPNLTNYSYDGTNSGLGGAPADNYSNHGTACAGIIAAKGDNNEGVSGVAPDCALIPINCANAVGGYSTMSIANAIRWAYQNQADVISLSWGSANSEYAIESAIGEVVSQGRNGLGCVVVCASGNENNDHISFPANLTTTYVISVGAVDRCGARAGRTDNVSWSCDPWTTEGIGSNFGSGLCVVAPGKRVLTTDLVGENGSNYTGKTSDHPDIDYTYFGGTSAACPFVAGVAALVLSANPQLSAFAVRSIINRTAQKINFENHYPYTQNHNDGFWNNELGYGLIDAYAAVLEASKANLFVRDTFSDEGVEPSHVTYMWNSPDIWIENQFGLRVDNPRGGESCKVCVRIWNADVNSSNGTQKLFLNWSKAGVNMPWPSGWDGSIIYSENGHSMPMSGTIGDANGITIPICSKYYPVTLKIDWDVPSGEDYNFGIFENSEEKWHFCLLARIHDGNDIIGENEQNYPIDQFVLKNNNVAWKNISVLQELHTAFVWVGNRKPNRHSYIFDIMSHKNTAGMSLLDLGEFYLRLNPSLVEDWQRGGGECTGLKYIGDNCFRITDENASLYNVEIPAGEFGWIESVVKFYTNQNPKDKTFTFDIAMRDDNELYGGEHYEAVYNEDRIFQAVAPEDKIAMPLEEISLYAGDVNEPANYIWFDEHGDTVAVGTTLTTIATKNQRYKLEVESTVDGYKSCDSVNVKLKKGIITTLSPNPAETQVSVAYRLAPTITGGTVQLTNMMGMVVKSEPFSQASTSVNINVNDLIYGQYTVKLVASNGEVLDSKVLVVR